jgi:hypothetical protein
VPTSRRTSPTFLLSLAALCGVPACGLISTGDGMDGADAAGVGGFAEDGEGAAPNGGSGGAASGGAAPDTGGTGGSDETGGCSAESPAELGCPGLCRALAEAHCEVPSEYAIFAVDDCSGGTRVTFASDGASLSCFYRGGSLAGAQASGEGFAFCDGSTITWGEQPTACPIGHIESCNETGEGGAGSDAPPALCYDTFSGSCAPCCPMPPPDCTNRPDGYPGYPCTQSSCSCSCRDEEWDCLC